MNETTNFNNEDVVTVAEVIWDASRADEGTISATGANHVARALLASGVVVPARVVEEAERKYTGVRDAGFSAALRAERAEAELSRLRSAVEALAERWERTLTEYHAETIERRVAIDQLRALLTEGRDRAGCLCRDPLREVNARCTLHGHSPVVRVGEGAGT